MIRSKKDLFIEYELSFLETKLEELKAYIEESPFSELQDRVRLKETKGGIAEVVVATKEAQRKDLTQALKDYAEILQTIDRLRALEPLKESKGDREVPSRMK